MTFDPEISKSVNNPGYVIHKNVSIRQVVDVSRTELNSGEWSYYIQAPFDFLVCNGDRDQSYELVVEYDGRHHDEPAQVMKDSLKDRICMNAGLPILRIGIDDVKVRGNTTILEFVLEHYFGEKAIAALRESGELSWEEEYSSQFSETVDIQKRLLKKGLFPHWFPLHFYNEGRFDHVENMYWYRIMENKIDRFRPAASPKDYWRAEVQVEILKGEQNENIIMSVDDTATIRDCNPDYNVSGVHGWHVAKELAKYLCFRTIEEKWEVQV